VHPDLPAEQAYLDRAHDHLATMATAATRLADGLRVAARTDVDASINEYVLRRYRAALDIGAATLCFGRIDEAGGDRWYIGRRHVEDDDGNPVVVDWRARVATPFYRATFADPVGLRTRRRFLLEGRTLQDIVEEDFADPASAHRASGIPDPLLAELDRARSGEMRDIVTTIQAEQDAVIRAPLDLFLVVQGGPGTGKTAVGLHRAALLLYEHRETLDRDGVLVVGPNRLFLRYISQVLPSLGETSVVQTTMSGLGAVTVREEEDDAVAALKGDERMATVIERAAWRRTAALADDVAVRTRFGGLVLRADDVNRILAESGDEGRFVTTARDRFRAEVTKLAFARLLERRPEGLKLSDEVAGALRGSADLRRALDRAWPATTAVALVRRLLNNRAFLATMADGVLDAEEQRRLHRKATRRTHEEPWTAADVALVDEAEAVLGGRPRRYGHLVVDEAQDFTAMGWRLLARRNSRFPSMTVLGDLAQSTAPGGQDHWEDVVRLVGGPDRVQRSELDVGYRVPDAIMAEANRLLPAAGVAVGPTRSVRSAPAVPEYVAVDAAELPAAVAGVAAELARRYATVAVIAPPDRHEALLGAGLSAGEALTAPVSLLTPPESKGLEFDAVVVVEPGAVMADGTRGVRLLYVAMTRAVQHLSVVHAQPLPPPLA
jgi:DNA helicase IV